MKMYVFKSNLDDMRLKLLIFEAYLKLTLRWNLLWPVTHKSATMRRGVYARSCGTILDATSSKALPKSESLFLFENRLFLGFRPQKKQIQN